MRNPGPGQTASAVSRRRSANHDGEAAQSAPPASPYSRREVIGDCTLYQGDCRDILPTLGKVDAVVTDPPYGINAARDRKSQKWGWRDYPASGRDKERPAKEVFDLLRSVGRSQIIWGGNYFADWLPPSGKWLIWDKCQSDFSLADAELAWCSFDGAVRRINYPRSKAMQDGKEHPTQKPVEVMVWTLQHLPLAKTIVDPFMGSGTTGVACVQTGRHFVGIEAEPHYFDVACRRIAEAVAQPRLFDEPPPKPTQERLFG